MSFAGTTRQRSGPVLPLAALVDVLFLLLAFFMTTSLFREQDLFMEVTPPAMSEGQSGGMAGVVNITVDSSDRIFIADREYDLPALQRTLEELKRDFPNERVVVRGDREATHGRVSEVRETAMNVGFEVYDRFIRRASEIGQ